MKKITIIVILGFLLLSPIASAEPNNKICNDVLLTSLSPAISNAISGYYGYPRLYGLYDAKILRIERVHEGEYTFNVTVQVKTFVGAHNHPFGLETMTIAVSPGSMLVSQFHHEGIN
ncbi:DUF3888 domain-containing protein [Paenibacillus dokdonensis]|uniref:DUF3888 domain-containing protein n=1 Tax=Paenibacillus dokdonensis TaxID=2567944 RepID=A0ABU6GPM6_9BACL|nr:DUF3888 domain-containing protein [Paenibacillus dokdonensis]MEC0241674.1 DUF3888 domain-containing protein [Paenibacillus dokdonensis]